jgi:hypothetical protein
MDYRILLAAPLAALVLSVSAAELRLPDGWQPNKMVMPSAPLRFGLADYAIGVDRADEASGARSLTIRSVGTLSTETVSFGAAHQLAYGYAGQRVRLAGQVRAEGTQGWAGLYMGAGNGELLSKLSQGLPGVEQSLPMGAAAKASGWQEVSVVIDVPADALSVDLGLALVGEGQVWVRGLRFEVVGPEVPVTRTPVGIDWQKARSFRATSAGFMARARPMPLRNAALD